MSKSSPYALLLVAALSLGVAIPAGATTANITYGQVFSAQAGAVNSSFDSSLTWPGGFSGAGLNQGVVPANTSSANHFAIPTSDTANYAYAGVGSSVTDTFSAPVSYIGIYWGSPDTYNTVTITDVNGTTFSYVPGSGPLASLNPSQSTAAYVDFFDAGAPWAYVILTSGGAAFEFDNIASLPAASPEPASVALFIGGLFAIGTGIFRRRKA